MNNARELEARLGVSSFISKFEQEFDKTRYSTSNGNTLHKLRGMRLFLYKRWYDWKPISKGTVLDSTDCLSLATIMHLLAARKGIDTEIVRPNKITRYFHAMLAYESDNGKDVFKVSGSQRKYDCKSMSVDQVERRIRYIRPLFNLVNLCRFGDKTPPHAQG